MPNPDMITQYLASRGAAPSAENASRVRQHYASNPDLLDRRALGLPGALDDNSSVLDAMLDKHIAESMPTPAGTVTVGQPEKVSDVPPPSRTGAAAKGPGDVGGTNTAKAGVPSGASRQAGYGPGASPNRQMLDRETAAPTVPAEGSNFTAGVGTGQQVGETQRSGLSEWLLGLLGGGAGLYGLSKMVGGGAPNAAPAGPVPGTVPPAATSVQNAKGQTVPVGANGWPAGTESFTDTTDPAVMKQRMQMEIDAENDAMMRKMAEDERVRRAQASTQETLDAARGKQREFGQAAKRAVRGR